MAVGGALFGGGRAGAAAKTSLVEFRAGKMTLGSDNMVRPDKRKGIILVDQTDDQLMHFKWKDRVTGNVEDDLIIFPDDIEFKKVPQCTTGRVFLLKFKSSNRKMFFWMQEPKADKDDDYCKKVNDFLNNPPAPGSTSRSGGSSGGLGGAGLDLNNLGDSELQSLLNNMSQQQLMQLFGGSLGGGSGGLGSLASLLGAAQSPGSGSRQRSTAARASRETPSTTASTPSTPAATPAVATAPAPTPSVTTSSSSAAPIQLSDLQSILSGIQMPAAAAGAAVASSGPNVDLSRGITAEVMQPLLANPEFVRKMKDLLPAEHQGEDLQDEIRGTVQSPQFQQALSLFSSAFQSGQLAPLIREFDLGEEAAVAATSGDMEAFVQALQKKQQEEGEEEGFVAGDESEDMALD